METPDLDSAQGRDDHLRELSGIMRWWRGIGLAAVLLAVFLFSKDMDTGGYIALATGWAILIYAIIVRHRKSRMAGSSVERG